MKSMIRTNRFLTALGLSIGLALVLVACGGGSSTPSGNTVTSVPTPTAQMPTPTPVPYNRIGQTINVTGQDAVNGEMQWQITILSARFGSQVGGNQTYLIVTISMVNTSGHDEDVFVGSTGQTSWNLKDFVMGNIYAQQDPPLTSEWTTIHPGQTEQGTVAFLVTSGSGKYLLQFTFALPGQSGDEPIWELSAA